MNPAKAREYFTDYHEGKLDRGLREAFERALEQDAALQADYRSFEGTLAELDVLKAVPEPPEDFHETLSARLDKHLWETRRDQPAHWMSWLKALALGGATLALLVVALLQLNGSGEVSQASTLSSSSQRGLNVRTENGRVFVSYPGLQNRSVTLRDQNGEVLQTLAVGTEEIKDKLIANSSPRARVMSLEVAGDSPVYLALPGTARGETPETKGTLKDMVRAFAAFYSVPVVLDAQSVDEGTEWAFDTDPVRAAQAATSAMSLNVELRRSGVLWIQSH